MKRIATLLILIVCSLTMVAQNVTQRGVTYRYNGKHPRTPMGGVYIKPVTAANGVVSDETNGTFTLTLQKLKMGSRIGSVRVTKQGMMVFNQQTVDEWNVRQEPLHLILCDANEFQRQKKNLIAIGERQAKKKYDKLLAELKKKNQDQQLQLDDYYNKLDSLEKNYQNALQHMDEYADVFARIDESEVDTVAQRAIELFHKGDIQTAIQMLESQDYMGRLTKDITTIAQAEALISTAERAKALAKQDKEKDLQTIKTLIAGYKLSNDWEKAGELLKGLADNLKTRDAVWEYAEFCYNQNDLAEAEAYYHKCRDMLGQKQGVEKEVQLAELQNNLALIYSRTQRFAESEAMHKLALAVFERLAKENPQAYEPRLAALYNNLAILYSDTQRLSESETMYKSALAIRERLAKANPQAYEPDLAASYNNLAGLYSDTQRLSESETMYKSALAIYERLVKDNPQAYEPYLAISYHNLAFLYYKIQRLSESETMYKSALAIYERLAKDNPQAYEPDLATSYNGLAELYSATLRLSESETMLKSALAILVRLVKDNPQVYETNRWALRYIILALCYGDDQRWAESEAMYKSALAIYECLAKANSQAYEPALATSYNCLAELYRVTQRWAESETMFKSALVIRERLAKDNPQAYEPNLAETYYCFAFLYSATQRWAESEAMYKSALAIYERLAKDHPRLYEEHLTQIDNNLSFSLNLLGKFNEAEHYALEAIKMDSTVHIAYTNLAASLLFQGKTAEAEKLYRQFKSEFKDGFLDDFAEYERLGVIPEERKMDVERIKAMLKAE